MKIKITIVSAVVLVSIAMLFSFSNGKESESKVAIITQLDVRGEDRGFIITYGDGSVEKIPFDIKGMDSNDFIQLQLKTTTIMNDMSEKGYHYVGTYESNLNYMVFEKK